VLRPRLTLGDAGLLTTALGVVVAEGIEATHGLRAGLKWPNDVTVSRLKLAGILVETRAARSQLELAVAGVGINVAWPCDDFPAELAARATSISCALERAGRSRAATRADLLGAILRGLDPVLEVMERGGDELAERASDRSDVLGRHVVVRLADGNVTEGEALRLLPSGALEIRAAGRTRALTAGEIERVRAS
jgi:BirA family biotin operon repressor/biotin-[acetyl-CoA-carboxylase] ligase